MRNILTTAAAALREVTARAAAPARHRADAALASRAALRIAQSTVRRLSRQVDLAIRAHEADALYEAVQVLGAGATALGQLHEVMATAHQRVNAERAAKLAATS